MSEHPFLATLFLIGLGIAAYGVWRMKQLFQESGKPAAQTRTRVAEFIRNYYGTYGCQGHMELVDQYLDKWIFGTALRNLQQAVVIEFGADVKVEDGRRVTLREFIRLAEQAVAALEKDR